MHFVTGKHHRAKVRGQGLANVALSGRCNHSECGPRLLVIIRSPPKSAELSAIKVRSSEAVNRAMVLTTVTETTSAKANSFTSPLRQLRHNNRHANIYSSPNNCPAAS